MTIEMVDEKSFDEAVIKSNKPVLVDFWASWCPSCIKLLPVLEKVAASSTEDTFRIVKVDADEAQGLLAAHKVKSLPTLLLFKNGEVVARRVGMCSFDVVMEMLSQ